MKYLKLFKTDAEYQQFIGGGGDEFLKPNVSLVTDTNSLFYNPMEEELPYLTITALEDNFQIELPNRYITPYCSLNRTEWVECEDGISPIINSGEKIYIKGIMQQGINRNVGSFYTEQRFNLSGNVMSMIFGDEAEGKTDLTGYDGCFTNLFQNCTGLVSVSKNFLPATILSENCYDAMFDGCTSLIQAPELPATTLAASCYYNMFQYCTSLIQAPELPATTLANSCYMGMFQECPLLLQAPELPATNLADWCYDAMFAGCTSLNYIKMLATDISAPNCLTYWVSNVSETGTFVKSADATWNVTGKSGIPTGWIVETV